MLHQNNFVSHHNQSFSRCTKELYIYIFESNVSDINIEHKYCKLSFCVIYLKTILLDVKHFSYIIGYCLTVLIPHFNLTFLTSIFFLRFIVWSNKISNRIWEIVMEICPKHQLICLPSPQASIWTICLPIFEFFTLHWTNSCKGHNLVLVI